MPTVDYLPVAAASGANVDSQGTFAGSGYQVNGMTTGQARSAAANKVWRQASMIGAAVANFIANQLGINVLDDGNLANLITNFTNAVATLAGSGSAPRVKTIAFSATPVFDCSSGVNPLEPKLEITLTGNVTSSTLTGISAGMTITVHIVEDGSGGHTFVPPANLPLAPIDTTANQVNTQTFHVLADGTTVVPATPMMLKN